MSDIKLFRLFPAGPAEIEGTSAVLEKSLQTLIEQHLEAFLGVRFLATEYSTGRDHGGRMDTLGIDENGCPVIIEYKRSSNENVINQGLFYLDWLMDHRKDFEWLVMERYGKESADTVEWSSPRLICIAGDFTKYDSHAVKQMNRNIELIRYRHYGEDLLLLDLVNSTSASSTVQPSPAAQSSPAARVRTVSESLAQADQDLNDRYEALKAWMMALGDDVQFKVLKHYFAFARLKNFACVEVHTRTKALLVYVKVDPQTVDLTPGLTRDVRAIGHFGTGDLEITLRSMDDFEKVKPLIERSYEAS
jgi:predicted transport protein